MQVAINYKTKDGVNHSILVDAITAKATLKQLRSNGAQIISTDTINAKKQQQKQMTDKQRELQLEIYRTAKTFE